MLNRDLADSETSDEADVFLEARDARGSDMERNSMVSGNIIYNFVSKYAKEASSYRRILT